MKGDESRAGRNEKIMAIAVVNGGETNGSSTAASTTQSSDRGNLDRAAVNANRNPSAVPAPPTSVPRSRLFQNARIWCLSVRIETMPAVVNAPWSVKILRDRPTKRIHDEAGAAAAPQRKPAIATAGSLPPGMAAARSGDCHSEHREESSALCHNQPFKADSSTLCYLGVTTLTNLWVALGVQHFRNPAIDNALAIGAGIFGIDGKVWHLQHLGQAGLDFHVGMHGRQNLILYFAN